MLVGRSVCVRCKKKVVQRAGAGWNCWPENAPNCTNSPDLRPLCAIKPHNAAISCQFSTFCSLISHSTTQFFDRHQILLPEMQKVSSSHFYRVIRTVFQHFSASPYRKSLHGQLLCIFNGFLGIFCGFFSWNFVKNVKSLTWSFAKFEKRMRNCPGMSFVCAHKLFDGMCERHVFRFARRFAGYFELILKGRVVRSNQAFALYKKNVR